MLTLQLYLEFKYRTKKMYFFSFLSILGWILFFSHWRKKYISYYPLLVMTGLVVILYISAFIKILNPVSTLLFVFGLFFLLKFFFRNRLKLSSPKEAIKFIKGMPLSSVFFVLSGLAWYFFTYKGTLFGWDEFFWGQFTKAVLSTNNFYTLNSAILSGKINYPPGIPLFHYFFLHYSRFSEGALYFSQGILVLGAVSLIFDLIDRNKKSIIIFATALFSAMVYFGPGLLSMTNDHILGAVFGGAILSSIYILRSNKSKLLLVPVIFFLPLLKSTGIILSLTIVLAASLDILLTGARQIKGKKQARGSIAFSVFILVVVLCVSAIIPMKSWDSYVNKQGVVSTSSIPSWSKIKEPFSTKATDREKLTLKNFNQAIISLPINDQEGGFGVKNSLIKFYLKIIKTTNLPGLSILGWLFAFSILFAIIISHNKPEKKIVILTACASLLVGLSVFLFLHLLVYLFYFSEFEGTGLASMSRYINSYILGLALITIGSIAVVLKENPTKTKLLGRVFGFILLYLFIFHTPPLHKLIIPPEVAANSTNLVREKTKPFSDYINSNTESSSKTWLIYQNTNGWECMMVRYDIVPRKMNGGDGSWSLGDKYGINDVWTNGMTAEAWGLRLAEEKYDYVFLAKSDDNFWRHYSKMFENPIEAKSHQLFQVQNNNNSVRLVAK